MERSLTVDDIRQRVARARRSGQRVGLVPTMGALHDGHLSLVRSASATDDLVIVSIFVNPTQFAPGEDLDAYPRDLEGDEALLRDLGDAAPDVVFAPAVEEVYPRPPLTTVHVAQLGERLCGRSRPTHFDGVSTVVAKLFSIVAPDAAYFGRKDHQQLAIVRRMAADLNLPVEVVGCPTVRESDGLAMSSRNQYLTDAERPAARALSRALRAAVETAQRARADGQSPLADDLAAAARRVLERESRLRVDYVEALDADELVEVGTAPRIVVAVAAYLGGARLIDNVVIGDEADEKRLLEATSESA